MLDWLAQTSLELRDPPVSVSQILDLKVCATAPPIYLIIFETSH